MNLELRPVIVDKEIVLIDMYIDDIWHGSRRTDTQCKLYFSQLKARYEKDNR